MMTSSLPAELWLKVLNLLCYRDKLSMRGTCSYFRELMDNSRHLWRGCTVVLRHFPRYNRSFWLRLAQRHVGSVFVRSADRKQLRTLRTWLPELRALRLDDCREGGVAKLNRFHHLQYLSITSCPKPLRNLDFLFPVSCQLTRLTLCNVQLTCSAPQLAAALAQLTRLKSLLLHHDGSLRTPAVGGVLAHLPHLQHLSWTMIAHKTLSPDFFSPAPSTGGALQELQLLDYDAAVSVDVLRPVCSLRSLSILHLYSVPGPVCHLRTWLTALTHLQELSVHGGHPLSAYSDLLPSSLRSLTLNVDLLPDDLQVVSLRAPHLEHLHLEPWGSSSNLIRLLPQFFPHLTTLRIRHHQVSDADFLSLQQLQSLHTLEILDSYRRPATSDPGTDPSSPRLLKLVLELQTQTDHRVRIIMSSSSDPLTCRCV